MKRKEKIGKAASLGRVQLRIMEVLWKCESASAREITDALNRAAGRKPLAHSTVQTLLRTLEAKGAVAHEVRDRTFLFRAVRARRDVASAAAHDLLARLFDSSLSGLVAHLLQHENVPPEEIARLRRLIDEAENGRKEGEAR